MLLMTVFKFFKLPAEALQTCVFLVLKLNHIHFDYLQPRAFRGLFIGKLLQFPLKIQQEISQQKSDNFLIPSTVRDVSVNAGG